jgi:hypothetical protein
MVFSDHIMIDPRYNYCFEPVFHGGLDNFYHYHPQGTLLLTIRKVDEWLDSVNNFNKLGRRIKEACKQPGYFCHSLG